MVKRKIIIVLIIFVFLLALVGCGSISSNLTQHGQLKVHFLDVGQADSILVQFPNGQNMLVDAGNNDDGNMVVKYLKRANVSKVDFLVGTHPHEDHIGGLDNVIRSFDIGNIYMPRVTHTTKTYEDVMKAVQSKKLKITPAKAGLEIINIDNLNVSIIAPHSASYKDLNNYSAVINVVYGQVSFLLTGDAEEQSEFEMLASSVVSPKADVLKIGHHGSSSATSNAFLKIVNPKYAVISVGGGNDYGHPHKETLKKLRGIQVFRTDLNGTIIFTTDGKEINVSTEKSN